MFLVCGRGWYSNDMYSFAMSGMSDSYTYIHTCTYVYTCVYIHLYTCMHTHTCTVYIEQLYVFFYVHTLPPSLPPFLPPFFPPDPFSHSSTFHRKGRLDEVPPGQTEESEPDLLGPEQWTPMVSLTMSTSDLIAVLEGHSLVSATHLPLPPSLHTPGATTVQSAQRKQRAIKGKVAMMGVKLGTTILPLHLPHTPESQPARIARCLRTCMCLSVFMHAFVIHDVTCLPIYVLTMCRCNCMHNYMYILCGTSFLV